MKNKHNHEQKNKGCGTKTCGGKNSQDTKSNEQHQYSHGGNND